MKFNIKMQESNSRGELLLRAFFGFFYIMIPHGLALAVMGIVSAIYSIVSFFSILINGEIPQGIYDFQVGILRWTSRVNARNYNLRDGYPEFGTAGTDEGVELELVQPLERNKVSVVLRFFFGVYYVMIPHGFCLAFLFLGMMFVNMIQFWIILITGKANEGMFNYTVGVMRWQIRVNSFMNYLHDTYPAFSMAPTPEELAADNNKGGDPFASR